MKNLQLSKLIEAIKSPDCWNLNQTEIARKMNVSVSSVNDYLRFQMKDRIEFEINVKIKSDLEVMKIIPVFNVRK